MLSSAAQSAIKAGKRPIRPTHQAFTNELWALTEHCWDPVPELRPEISAVFETLRGLLVSFLSSRISAHRENTHTSREEGTG